MSQTKPQNDYQQIMHTAIMKAFEVGELRLQYKTPQTARSMRARLYAFIKQQRGKADTPLAFIDAAAELTFSVDGSTLVMVRKDQTESFSVMLEAVGRDAAQAAPDVKHQDAEASLERFKELMRKQEGGTALDGDPSESEEYKARMRAYRGES